MNDTSPAVIAWWVGLSVVSVLNLAIWARITVRFVRTPEPDPGRRRWQAWQLALSTAFVFGCAFRSFLPRAEGQRFCLYDGWISDAPIARIIATVAELSFVAQTALILNAAGKAADQKTPVAISWVLVPLIAWAEVCSWYTALTTDFLGSIFEESTWALTFTFAGVAFVWLRPHYRGNARRLLTVAVAAAVVYVTFMCTVDVPMYVGRHRRDETAATRYLTVGEGWRDSWSRRVFTRRWEDWRPEMPWMSLYFSAAVWLSLLMTRTPRLEAGEPSRAPGRAASGPASRP